MTREAERTALAIELVDLQRREAAIRERLNVIAIEIAIEDADAGAPACALVGTWGHRRMRRGVGYAA